MIRNSCLIYVYLYIYFLRGRYFATNKIEYSGFERTHKGTKQFVQHRSRRIAFPSHIHGANFIPGGRSTCHITDGSTFKRLKYVNNYAIY